MHRKVELFGREARITAACLCCDVNIVEAVFRVGEQAEFLEACGNTALNEGLVARCKGNVVVTRD